ncbi:hypothetical protein SOCE26_047230 [Sorangium cellulosum]|uniref:Uncharacterized protein n=1 Tax=Sorangium cellulosum TaxID=56 RepID=A0A2L0EVI9_SORCE|nr:hypothetical protein [Sorangium cellulosum]AUX43279.1 hypothetical protein SOCE26_047230 [Sorangium cellulosum]
MSNSSTRGRQSTAQNPPARHAPRPSPTQRRERGERSDPGWARNDAGALRDASPPINTTELDDPFAIELQDAGAAPPLRAKVTPRSEIRDVVPTLDDEVRGYHHHPNDAGSTGFESNPDAADAAADLASDLGAEFLEGATRGQDLSDVVMSHDDDGDLPYLLEDEDVESAEQESEAEDEEPVTQRVRRH